MLSKHRGLEDQEEKIPQVKTISVEYLQSSTFKTSVWKTMTWNLLSGPVACPEFWHLYPNGTNAGGVRATVSVGGLQNTPAYKCLKSASRLLIESYPSFSHKEKRREMPKGLVSIWGYTLHEGRSFCHIEFTVLSR